MSPLAEKQCVPCKGGVPPLDRVKIATLEKELHESWAVEDFHYLKRTFTFKNFAKALDFTNAVGAIAEREGHHPDIFLTWGRVEVSISTHAINGLTESDFILAAKIDLIP